MATFLFIVTMLFFGPLPFIGKKLVSPSFFFNVLDTVNFNFPDFHFLSNWAAYFFFILCLITFRKSRSTLAFGIDVFTMIVLMRLVYFTRKMLIMHTYSYLFSGRGHCKGIKYNGRSKNRPKPQIGTSSCCYFGHQVLIKKIEEFKKLNRLLWCEGLFIDV